MTSVATGTEAVAAELEAILGSFAASRARARRPPPPASKALVAGLPVVTADEACLRQLGQGARCSVCTGEERQAWSQRQQ